MMQEQDRTNYGPLSDLLGTWRGNQGMDVAPTKAGSNHTPYSETLIISGKGMVTNAQIQQLAVLHYHQSVQKIADGETFHDQCGYWMWDESTDTVIHSFVIPRGVCVLAGGEYEVINNQHVFDVNAANDDVKWPIIQSPFMSEQAKSTHFQQHLELESDRLFYKQTTRLEIYDELFEHSDENHLQRAPD